MQTFSPIRGLTSEGKEVWFTGRAGAAFISADKAEAFIGFNLDGARRKAKNLNEFSSLHGVRFVAVCAE